MVHNSVCLAMVLADGIVVRDNTSVGGGKGLFVTIPIKKGEWIWKEDPEGEPHYMSTPRTIAWVEALPEEAQRAYRHFMCALWAAACSGGRRSLCATAAAQHALRTQVQDRRGPL